MAGVPGSDGSEPVVLGSPCNMTSIVPHTTFVARRLERARVLQGVRRARGGCVGGDSVSSWVSAPVATGMAGERLTPTYTWAVNPNMASSPRMRPTYYPRMRPAYYPAMLDLADRDALLVGGGEIAAQKARPLLDAGVRLRIVAPALTAALQAQNITGTYVPERTRVVPDT